MSIIGSTNQRGGLCTPGTPGKGNSQLDGRFFKTKLCTFYQAGRCSRGNRCTFAHAEESLKDRPDLRCTKPCREFFTRGTCKKGDACTFAHWRKERLAAAKARSRVTSVPAAQVQESSPTERPATERPARAECAALCLQKISRPGFGKPCFSPCSESQSQITGDCADDCGPSHWGCLETPLPDWNWDDEDLYHRRLIHPARRQAVLQSPSGSPRTSWADMNQ
mmetsp:Transcript_49328/g.107406  ORF Transcript_49328/g.107406 Transcript_49328/m.107406 type:complete len:222 (+) Transcript_49328:59-724(+)